MEHDARYWLKWTAGNDVRGGQVMWVGGDGMLFRWECVLCCIGAYPTSPSSPPALRSGAGSTMTSTITACRGPAMLCLCNMEGVPLQTSFKIANSFSLHFAILMGVLVHSSCFAYSEVPDCSLPGAQKLQSCWTCP